MSVHCTPGDRVTAGDCSTGDEAGEAGMPAGGDRLGLAAAGMGRGLVGDSVAPVGAVLGADRGAETVEGTGEGDCPVTFVGTRPMAGPHLPHVIWQ